MGLGVDAFHTTVVVTTKMADCLTIKGVNKPVVLHSLRTLARFVRFVGRIDVEVLEQVPSHIGLASNAMLSLAVAVGFNESLGRPLTNRTLRRFLGYNYVEEYEPPGAEFPEGRVIYGMNVGTSHAAGMYGGLVLLTSDVEIVSYQRPLPTEKVLICIPRMRPKKAISDEPEIERLLTTVRSLDSWQAQGRIYKVFMDLIPAIRKRDFAKIGEIYDDLLLQGHQLSLFRNVYRYDLLPILGMFREESANVCGISSGGPTIFATGSAEALGRIRTRLQDSLPDAEVMITDFSSGLTVTIGGSERKYCLQPLEAE